MKRLFLICSAFSLFLLAATFSGANPSQKPKSGVKPETSKKKETNETSQQRRANSSPPQKSNEAGDSKQQGSGETLNTENNTNSSKENNTNSSKKNGTGDNEPSFWALLLNILLWVVGIAAVLFLVGGVVYLIRRFVKDTNEKIEQLRGVVSTLNKTQARLAEKNQGFYRDLENLDKQFKKQADEISALKREKDFQTKQSDHRISFVSSLAGFTPEPEFPVSVDEFLDKNGHNGIVAKFDYKTNLLIEDPSGDGALMIIRDDGVQGDLPYVIPRFGSFKAKDDFYTHLERYYSCQNPRGGTVWIKEPSTVETVENGWVLRQKGEIEVR